MNINNSFIFFFKYMERYTLFLPQLIIRSGGVNKFKLFLNIQANAGIIPACNLDQGKNNFASIEVIFKLNSEAKPST